MPIGDLEVLDYLERQYDGDDIAFDKVGFTSECSWAFKSLPDEDLFCFEGSHNIPDWLRDFQGAMVYIDGVGGIHLGGYTPLPAVLEIAKTLLKPEKPKKICGHSLGAGEAEIFAVMLDRDGFSLMEIITFGRPTFIDAEAGNYLAPYPNRSYWNYHDALHHDPVGNVAIHIPIIAPYVPLPRILVDCPPPIGDEWGDFLGWHHLSPNYKQGLINLGVK
jgi:hypothetical protein